MSEPLRPLYPEEEEKLIDREGEKNQLYHYLDDGKHVYVFGIAGVGKTSFVNVALGGPTGKQQMKQMLSSNTLVIFYEISEDGRLKKKDYSPDDWPSPQAPKPKRAVVVIDEFHRLTWLSTWEEERLLGEIEAIKYKAETVQFVFVADLPIRDVTTYREMVLYFRWENLVDSDPQYIRLLPMRGDGDKKARDIAKDIRKDQERRSGKKDSPPTLVLLGSECTIVLPSEKTEDFTEDFKVLEEEIAGGIGEKANGEGVHPMWALRLPDAFQLGERKTASEEKIEEKITEVLQEAWRGRKKERNILKGWARQLIEDKFLRRGTRYTRGLAPLPEVILREEIGSLKSAVEIVRASVGASHPPTEDPYIAFLLLRNIGQRIYGLFLPPVSQKYALHLLWWVLRALFVGAFILLVAVDPLGSASWLKESPQWLSSADLVPLRWIYLLLGYAFLGWGYYRIFQFYPCLTPNERVLRFAIGVPLSWLLFALLVLFLSIQLSNWLWLSSMIAIVIWVSLLAFLKSSYEWLREIVHHLSSPMENPLARFKDSLERTDFLTLLVATSWSGMWLILPFARLLPPGWETGKFPWVLFFWLLAFAVSLSGLFLVYHPSKVSPLPDTIQRIGIRYIIIAGIFIFGIFLQRNHIILQGLENIEASFITLLLGIGALIWGIQKRLMYKGHTGAIL